MNQKIKILHLEDVPFDAELIARELKKGKIDSEILVVDNKADFINALKKFSPDIILSDHSLPSFNSSEALKIVKEAGMEVPFILITATVSEEFAVDVMKRGAYDYILKDRLQRLPSAVINSIEKHRLEEEQQAAHERLVFHIENTPLGFIEWDDQGFAKSWSKRAEEIFGWSEKEFIESQETGFSQVYEEDLPWVSKMLAQLISGEVERNKVQYRNIAKCGGVIWCEWFNSVLKDKDGKVKTIMSLVQDITEQKQQERQKDDFLSMASHELKTPVTTIKAYGQIAESMLEEKGDVETLDIINRMNTQVNRLTTLIGNLLDFTKIQKGKLMYNEAFFDFNELVKEVIDDMQKTSYTHEIINNSGKTVTIFGDKDKLSQVLNNLISNAIKYSPKADRILVSTELQKDGIELSVQDFGIGILAESQQNVFQQFYRVTGDNQSTFPGLGIGLYICSEIITMHGGKIWVESTVDKGSTFYSWLPFDHRNNTT
jgi:PAS domain S-box-containing protein